MTTQTTTLADFLLARIAEDETRAARKADTLLAMTRPDAPITMVDTPFSPTRVLAECKAKRRIVDWAQHFEMEDAGGLSGDLARGAKYAFRDALVALALPYADHDDYREEWKP